MCHLETFPVAGATGAAQHKNQPDEWRGSESVRSTPIARAGGTLGMVAWGEKGQQFVLEFPAIGENGGVR